MHILYQDTGHIDRADKKAALHEFRTHAITHLEVAGGFLTEAYASAAHLSNKVGTSPALTQEFAHLAK
mgnify:CR=1 FL=1